MADTYQPINFVQGELLTSQKMNTIAANQDGFHTGEALGDGIIGPRHLGDDIATSEDFVDLVSFNESIANVSFRKSLDRVSIAFQGESKTHSQGAALFTLPVGYRPLDDTYLPFVKNGNAFGYLTIKPSGECYINLISSTSATGRVVFMANFPTT